MTAKLDPQKFRDRIKEFRRVPASELLDNEKNWRVHPYAQRQALKETLEKIGMVGACTAYISERNGGKLTLIDGHMRRSEIGQSLPTIVLDVNDEEADMLLLTLDPMREMATHDSAKLSSLLESARMETPAVEDMLRNLKNDLRDQNKELQKSLDAEGKDVTVDVGEGGPPEMELQPFESYDYVVALFRTTFDFQVACEKLGIRKVGFTLKDGKTRKIGVGRVIDGGKLLQLMK